MANFDDAMTVVLRHEGGMAVNTDDNGGPTNYGISTPTYSLYIGRPATLDDIVNMPLTVAKKIYAQYWLAVKGDGITSQDVANVFMDMAVLRGLQAASKSIQKVLGLKQDGVIGPASLAAINAANPGALMYGFQRECVSAFCRIVYANPTQLKFLSNWTSRVLELNPVMRA